MRDYLFTISISTQAYSSKPTESDYRSMVFREQTLTVNEFADKIRQGYSYCYIFNHTGTSFESKVKTNDNFKHSNILSVDCDNMSAPMDEYLTQLPTPPTISYTTPSNGIKGYNYRLVYLLDKPITTKTDFEAKYYGLLTMLGISPKGTNDDCAASCSQLMNGSYNCQIKTTDTVLRTDDIPAVCAEKKRCEKKEHRQHASTSDSAPVSGTFMDDWTNMSRYDFLCEYEPKFDYLKFTTQKDYDSNGVFWHDETFCEVRPLYKYKKGEAPQIRKIPISKRAKSLYAYANDLRFINKDISVEGMLYALTYIVHYWFDNSDGQCHNGWIRTIGMNVMSEDIDGIKPSRKPKHRYEIDEMYAISKGMSKQQVRVEVERTIKDEAISQWFDPLLSNKENIAVLKSHGVTRIGAKTMQSYRERYKFDKKSMRMEILKALLKDGKSDEYIIKELDVSRATYYRLKAQSQN